MTQPKYDYDMPELKPMGRLDLFGDSDVRIEKNFRQPYSTWKADPTPANADTLLSAVKPIMDKALRSYVGLNPSPVMRSRAKAMTLGALQNYDPAKAQLNTHLLSQLQGLRRHAAKETRIVSVPEQVSLDWFHLKETENRIKTEEGRDPSDIELADQTGISLKRIAYVRSMKPTVSEGTYMPNSDDGGEETMYSPSVSGDSKKTDEAWLQFVYQDLDPVDKVIVEHTLGMNGKPILSNQSIAAKLRISAPAVSQRKSKIQSLLNRQEEFKVF